LSGFIALWGLRGRSPFKIQMTLWILFWTYWEQIEKFQLQISCFLCIHLYEWWIMSLKPSYWSGSSSMKIYEILGWNKVHRKIIFIILFHL
jgi:hypothetical protein